MILLFSMSRLLRDTVILVLLLAAAFCCPARSGAQRREIQRKIEGKEGELDRLRREIREERARIQELRKKEKDIGKYLERLRKEAGLTRELLEGIEEKKAMLEEQVEDLRSTLQANENNYARRLKLFSGRLRAIYKEGERSIWQEILESDSFSELVQKYKFFVIVASRDAAMVEDLKKRKDRISREETELTSMLYQVTMAESEKRTELERLEKNRRERKKALSGLEAEEAERQRKIENLAAAERNLVEIIAGLEKRRDALMRMDGDYGEPEFESLRGRMTRPAEGPTARKFGKSRHPRYGTVTFNSGVDIKAREGSPIRAVARGRVEYSGALSGYGNCIIVNHGGGYYSLYARIGRIFASQGDQVEEGDVIAEIEKKGSSKSDDFHFEIRRSKEALDPGEWFK